MRFLLRKILVVLVIMLPLFSSTDCKKQKKCGCGKDVLFTLTDEPSNVYFNPEGTIMSLQTVGDAYSTYTFCNPGEMFPSVKDFKNGQELMVSGNVYWDCNYVWQQSNYNYNVSLYKQYNIYVTKVYLDMYGKK